MNVPFFSIIIPVYNVENYLNECAESIFNQNFVDYQVIFVDDGSTDLSGIICDNIVKKHDRAIVIHQKNGGLSAARNTGIKNAKGEYILFIDSDDYIADFSLKNIYDALFKHKYPDVLFLDEIMFYSNGMTEATSDGYIAERINNKSHFEVLEHMATLNKYSGSAGTKALKRTLFDDKMMFTEGIISEDNEWTIRMFLKAETYAYESFPYMFYRKGREGSITNTVTSNSIESMLWIIRTWAEKVPKNKYKMLTNSFVAYIYMILLLDFAIYKGANKAEYLKTIKEYKWVLNFGKMYRVKLVNKLTRLIGISGTCYVLKVVYTFKHIRH